MGCAHVVTRLCGCLPDCNNSRSEVAQPCPPPPPPPTPSPQVALNTAFLVQALCLPRTLRLRFRWAAGWGGKPGAGSTADLGLAHGQVARHAVGMPMARTPRAQAAVMVTSYSWDMLVA